MSKAPRKLSPHYGLRAEAHGRKAELRTWLADDVEFVVEVRK
jgi:hypothetical protein